MGNTQENTHHQLWRSYSLELPMNLKRTNSTLPNLPSFDNTSPHVRYSTNQQLNKQRGSKEKHNRLSLNNGPTKNNQTSSNRPVYKVLS
jgi:hypothetical protein